LFASALALALCAPVTEATVGTVRSVAGEAPNLSPQQTSGSSGASPQSTSNSGQPLGIPYVIEQIRAAECSAASLAGSLGLTYQTNHECASATPADDPPREEEPEVPPTGPVDPPAPLDEIVEGPIEAPAVSNPIRVRATPEGIVVEERTTNSQWIVLWPSGLDGGQPNPGAVLAQVDVLRDAGLLWKEASSRLWLLGELVPFDGTDDLPNLACDVSLAQPADCTYSPPGAGRTSAAALAASLAAGAASLEPADPGPIQSGAAPAARAATGERVLGSASPPSPVGREPAQGVTQSSAPLAAPVDGVLPSLAVALLLGLLPALLLYHRLARTGILENGVRKRIYDAVASSPGITVQGVAREAGVSHSTATYHLALLSESDMIVSNPDGNKVRFYQNGGRFDRDERAALPVLQNVAAVTLLERIVERPAAHRAELAAQMGVSTTTLNWYLRKLFECGLVREEREGRRAPIYPAHDRLAVLVPKLLAKAEAFDDATRERLSRLAGRTLPAEAASQPMPLAAPSL